MENFFKPSRVSTLLRAEWRDLSTFQTSDRLWQMPLAAALASGVPLLVGAFFDHLDYGLISSLGGLAFLYLPSAPLSLRMAMMTACAFGMIASYALGAIVHFVPAAMTFALVFLTSVASMACRFYRVPPPGAAFFVMVAAIGMYTPGAVDEIPLKVGLFAMGALLASLIAFFYSIHAVRAQPPKPMALAAAPSFDFVVFDPIMIGLFVGGSLALAQGLGMERAYWAPVSCAAVIQGASLRAIWTKQTQRILGTAAGLLVAWGLLSLPLGNWTAPFVVMALAFAIESLVVRHYGLAAIFITPMAIFLAETSSLGRSSIPVLISERFYDTLLGCGVGLFGGACIHSPRFRAVVGERLRALVSVALSR